jgi:hypothetical protein
VFQKIKHTLISSYMPSCRSVTLGPKTKRTLIVSSRGPNAHDPFGRFHGTRQRTRPGCCQSYVISFRASHRRSQRVFPSRSLSPLSVTTAHFRSRLMYLPICHVPQSVFLVVCACPIAPIGESHLKIPPYSASFHAKNSTVLFRK